MLLWEKCINVNGDYVEKLPTMLNLIIFFQFNKIYMCALLLGQPLYLIYLGLNTHSSLFAIKITKTNIVHNRAGVLLLVLLIFTQFFANFFLAHKKFNGHFETCNF